MPTPRELVSKLRRPVPKPKRVPPTRFAYGGWTGPKGGTEGGGRVEMTPEQVNAAAGEPLTAAQRAGIEARIALLDQNPRAAPW